MAWAGTAGVVPARLEVRHARGAGDLGVLRVVLGLGLGLGPMLRVEELTRRQDVRRLAEGQPGLRSHLVVVLRQMTVVDHGVGPRPPTPRPGRAGRHRLLLGPVVDAGLAVQTGGVRAGAVQAPSHPGGPLFLQELGYNGLHGLSCLVK